MRAPLSWIREFTPLDAPVPEVGDALSRLGLEVEAIDEPGRDIGGVVAARALDVRPHPNADKLTLVDVDYGLGQATVVCGAPNVVAGMVVPYAPPGARLPGGMTLERRKIRGQVSEGMLCSARELELGDDHAGIVELPPDTIVGLDVREVLALDDVVFDLSITPNRPDAMSMIGVARDLAAHFGLPLRVPEPEVAESGRAAAEQARLLVEAPDRCPRYVARVATVALGPSPEWMARRLTLAGMRPISNVVDVTNYVLLERGQPLHAFDLARLGGREIVVRLAAEGEEITTLDGLRRPLVADDLLICDGERVPQAIAGVMGGGGSEVSGATTEILLESAYFAPMGITRTSKRLGLRTESSARFERGVDPNGVRAGADRACELLAQVAAAAVAPGALDAYPVPIERSRVTLRTARVSSILGTSLSTAEVRAALEPLGIEIVSEHADTAAPPDSATLGTAVPTFRPDLEREIDLVEEVARRIGLDTIARTLPHTTAQGGGLTRRQRERRLVADVLVGMGCSEAMTVPLVAAADLERCGLDTEAVVEAANSLRAEESILRPRILPGLLGAAARNVGRGLSDLALFEMGHVFGVPAAGQTLPDERDHVAVVLEGRVRRRPEEEDRAVDAHDLLDILLALGGAFEIADIQLVAASAPPFAPERAAAVLVDGAPIGHAGELTRETVAACGLEGTVVALELDLDALLDGARRDRAFQPPSRFPASAVDLAFTVADHVAAGDLAETLRDAGGELLEDIRLFDVFRSEVLGAGRKSLAYAVRFRAPDRTLTDDEVGDLRKACIDAVVHAHGAELRG